MWFPFWRSRERFSVDELRYLTDQLQKFQIVNDVNKDFVIEALRSIAELVTYGDQNDPSFFDFFMEKQIMGEFVRILRVSRPVKVALQLLQTMSIMIQNLRSEHAIYYIFSNEHINYLISYSFDFRNEELLSYYISFLRAISGKLNRNTISLLVKTENDKIASFPLYTEAIRFAFHEESMVRIAVRALTLNVYHVGDDCVNEYISRPPLADYFSSSVNHFRKQCINLDKRVSQAATNPESSDATSSILTAVDEIEDTLYYFSDVISAGVPALAKVITDNIVHLLVFPLILPALRTQNAGAPIGFATSLYLLCCILRIVKTKDLASVIAATLFYPPESFVLKPDSRPNGSVREPNTSQEFQRQSSCSPDARASTEYSANPLPESISSDEDSSSYSFSRSSVSASYITLREALLAYLTIGDEIQALGSLSLLSTLLQTKELDESMLDGLGILPQRKQHKKLLLQALVGEASGEERLFSSENCIAKDDKRTEFDLYLLELKEQYGQCGEVSGINPQMHRYQVLDALVSLFCRSDLPAETLWVGGWLLRQLLPHGEEEFTSHHLMQLKDSHKHSTARIFEEIRGSWCDLLIAILKDEWRNCKRAIEGSSTPKDPKSILLPPRKCTVEGESSFAAGESMCEMVKVFVLQCQLLSFSFGGSLPDQPPVYSPMSRPEWPRARNAGFDVLVPKPGSEINLADAVPCRIAFERGKERHFSLLAISNGTAGWVLLADELPLKQQSGVVRITAPLAGSNPRMDEKHPKWLHLRIRPSTLPSLDPSKYDAFGKGKAKALVDGRWTLAFRDEESCKLAESMIVEEMRHQCSEVEKRLKPFLDLDISRYPLAPPSTPLKSPLVNKMH